MGDSNQSMDDTSLQEMVVLRVEDPMIRTNGQPAHQVAAASTTGQAVARLVTWVGGTATALWAGMVAMYELKVHGSPQQLLMRKVIVSISSVLIFACYLSGAGLLVVYRRKADGKKLYVRVLLMFFFLTAFLSPFLILAGLIYHLHSSG